MLETRAQRDFFRQLDRPALQLHQLARLNALLATILPANQFYARKFAGLPRQLASLDDLPRLPLTTKDELLGGGNGWDQPANLTFPLEHYVRFHQTSGTRGRPLAVYDTADDWQWWLRCWQYVLDAAEVEPHDCVLMAFSFGPFIGFWSAYEAASARGCLVVPGGGLSSIARLEWMRSSRATVVFCTPSYALHLAEIAEQKQFPLAELPVRRLVLAGEPGGSLPAVRARIEQAWQARVLDHAGATEVGPWGIGRLHDTGLHVLESEFICELLEPEGDRPAAAGALAELVLTNLGRVGSPVIRYRTGDLVRGTRPDDPTCRFVLLDGGVVSRADDMLVIRGVNVFPSSIEQIVRSFPEVVEFRTTVFARESMDQLLVEIEDRLKQPRRVADELRLRLGLKVEVQCVPAGSLPRFEGKGRRCIDRRTAP